MKTNNVDFGKSFKFIWHGDKETVYTCHKANKAKVCKVSWPKAYGSDSGNTNYPVVQIENNINSGSWIVLPTDMKEIVGESQYPIKFDTGNLLDQIKDFTANSNHSIFIHDGKFEVYQAGLAEFPYQCKDEEVLKIVMGALKVLDGVLVDEVIGE